MLKLAHVPDHNHARDAPGAEVRHIHRPRARPRYYAFLSYSHKDEEIAGWLHSELEDFRVPHALAGKLTVNGIVPKRLKPIFRDEHELAAADDLGEEIESALASSQFLIVLCSPSSAKSRWTNAEIEAFKRVHPEGCVLAAIAAGEPFASEMPGREDEECFPPALRQKFDRRGRPTGKRAEPLAADLREEGGERRLGLLRLIAGMLGVGLDDLVQRETTRRHRRLAWLTAASLAGMIVTSGLAVTAIQARDSARDQRREAEGLVAFMLGDLKDKLEPIGRLDALDGVGSRVLAYYSQQNKSELSDASLLQRSRALNLMAQVSYRRGRLDDAVRLFREAKAGTAEAIRRKPDDPQRLFEHAQNFFYEGEIARQRGNLAAAEAAYGEYKRLAVRMVELDPDNMKWRMEGQYADADLGIVFAAQRRFPEAAANFEQALRTIEALSTADPGNSEYRKQLALVLAWLADTRLAQGQFDQAVMYRKRHVALLEQLLASSGGDVDHRLNLITAHRALGNLHAARGRMLPALEEFHVAVRMSEQLIPTEPNNALWVEAGANAHLDLAEQLLAARQFDEAAGEANAGCTLTDRLLTRDQTAVKWRVAQRKCLALRSRLALGAGDNARALSLAQQALATARTIRTGDPTSDRFILARSYRLLGDVRRAAGDARGAQADWQSGLAAIPVNAAEKPAETSEHQQLLERLGRRADAQRLAARLDSIGYSRTAV